MYPLKSTSFFWSQFSAAAHPLGVAYCKTLLASKLLRQGEDVVRAQPKDAFTVAAVVVALWYKILFVVLCKENNMYVCPQALKSTNLYICRVAVRIFCHKFFIASRNKLPKAFWLYFIRKLILGLESFVKWFSIVLSGQNFRISATFF